MILLPSSNEVHSSANSTQTVHSKDFLHKDFFPRVSSLCFQPTQCSQKIGRISSIAFIMDDIINECSSKVLQENVSSSAIDTKEEHPIQERKDDTVNWFDAFLSNEEQSFLMATKSLVCINDRKFKTSSRPALTKKEANSLANQEPRLYQLLSFLCHLTIF